MTSMSVCLSENCPWDDERHLPEYQVSVEFTLLDEEESRVEIVTVEATGLEDAYRQAEDAIIEKYDNFDDFVMVKEYSMFAE